MLFNKRQSGEAAQILVKDYQEYVFHSEDFYKPLYGTQTWTNKQKVHIIYIYILLIGNLVILS